MDHKPTAKTGIVRIWAAFFYSLNGLCFAIRNEAAFRQEFFIIAILLVVLLFLPFLFCGKEYFFSHPCQF